MKTQYRIINKGKGVLDITPVHLHKVVQPDLSPYQKKLTAGANISIDVTNPDAPVISATGGTDISGKVDKVAGSSLIADTSITRLANTSGTNTGDQDLSSYETIANNDIKLAGKANLSSVIRESFTYSGSQLFPLANTVTNVYSVTVRGVGLSLSLGQYQINSGNILQINDTLETVNGVADNVEILYNYSIGDATSYTKVESDTNLSNKVDKSSGKSLIADTEITRLASVTNQVANLSIENKNANTFDIVSSNGTGATAPAVTTTQAGLMSASDKVALNEKVSGTGTTNYIPKFTANGVLGNSNIFNLSNNVGIGTTSPTETLDVKGSIKTNQFKFWRNGGSGTQSEIVALLDGLNILSPSRISFIVANGYPIHFTGSGEVQFKGGSGETLSSFGSLGEAAISLKVSDIVKFKVTSEGAQVNGIISASNATLPTQVPTWGQTTVSPIYTGVVTFGKFTDGTEPVYVKGAQYFNTTINKMKIGGATTWETLTSS